MRVVTVHVHQTELKWKLMKGIIDDTEKVAGLGHFEKKN